ncbi:MAG: hypothetical protein QM730_15700 [Anaerolineales bacterium]
MKIPLILEENKMRNYHGDRYLSADMFVSYCNDLKVDLDSFQHDLEFYEKEQLIFPVARVIKPREYILARRQMDSTSENFGKRIEEWDELEMLLFGNDNDAWHDFDRAFQDGKNKYIIKPELSNFCPWESYRVNVDNSDGQNYLVANATHYYHYWQIHQIYELQRKYPIYAKHNWAFQRIKESDPNAADWLFPGKPSPITNFYGHYKFFDALSVYIHLYKYEHRKVLIKVWGY